MLRGCVWITGTSAKIFEGAARWMAVRPALEFCTWECVSSGGVANYGE